MNLSTFVKKRIMDASKKTLLFAIAENRLSVSRIWFLVSLYNSYMVLMGNSILYPDSFLLGL